MQYRDSKTGRFASAKTWRRSRGQNGTRYRRIKAHKKAKGRTPQKPRQPPPAAPLGYTREIGPIPAEFLAAQDEYFKSGYEAPDEDEY